MGEEAGGSVYVRCPGEGKCDLWDAAAGSYDERIEAGITAGCRDCGGRPPLSPDDGEGDSVAESEEVAALIDDIEDIVGWEDAGFATDWRCYRYEIKSLVKYWRLAEREVIEIRATRMQAFIKGFFKE